MFELHSSEICLAIFNRTENDAEQTIRAIVDLWISRFTKFLWPIKVSGNPDLGVTLLSCRTSLIVNSMYIRTFNFVRFTMFVSRRKKSRLEGAEPRREDPFYLYVNCEHRELY